MKKLFLIITLLTISFSSKAQNSGFESILLAAEDAGKLTGAYVNPAMKGLITGMNGGWYHTAKVHKKFGFDISIGLNASFIPSKDEMFDISSLNLSGNTTITNGVTSSPTFAGSNSIIPADIQINTTINGQNVQANFTMPEGVKEDLPISAIPAPAVQFNLGLPYKLEVMGRFVPKIGDEDVEAQLFGLGLKKEITSWFGPLDKLPLHVSLLAAYTNMTVDYDLARDINSANVSTTDGITQFKLNAYTVQAIASLNFPIINIYGGVGYGGGNSNMNILGTYELTYNTFGGGTVSETLTDPVKEKFSEGGMRATLGTRLSLGFFKIFADYTFQDYNTVNAGIAFSFR